jgi:hypothetical protein
MKNLNYRLAKKIEHRGFDFSASKNFGLEMKIVNEYNKPANVGTKPAIEAKSNKKED